MKKLVFVLLSVFVTVTFTTMTASAVKSSFKNYEITALDDLHFGKAFQKVWTLKYNESEMPVTIVKRKTAEGTEYRVHTQFFEICYAATAEGFGARPIRKSCGSVPAYINKAVINQEQLKRQKVITPGKVDDDYAVGLIAGFLPELVNEGYEHLLN